MTLPLNRVLYPARERSKQDTEITHAALERAEGRGEGPRHNSPSPRSRCLISLPESPVVERSTCAHDNTMHTEKPTERDGRSTQERRRHRNPLSGGTRGVATAKTQGVKRASQGSQGLGGGDPLASKNRRHPTHPPHAYLAMGAMLHV